MRWYGALPMRAAAFFDLDRTLLTVNSAALWIRRERRLGRVTLGQLTRAALYMASYKLGVLEIDKAMDEAAATIRGESNASLRHRTEAWWAEEVAQHAAPGAQAVLNYHRAAGRPLVLLTSSTPWAGDCAQRQFGLDHVLCTRFEMEDERATGRVLRPVCYGEGKVAAAEAFAADHGINLSASAFYTDSYTDLPMLLRVARPFVVHPDFRLAREARRRDWPVLDWRR